MNTRAYIGTAGLSVWHSTDRGETWARPYSESGLYLEARCWALSAHPSRPGQVFAGTDSGLYRFDVADLKWRHLRSPMDEMQIWALAQAPDDPDVLLAGTRPAALFRSEDGGRHWQRLDVAFAESCIYVGVPRITAITFDPVAPERAFVSVEIDGVWRSGDGGRSFERCGEGLESQDGHDLAVMATPDGPRLFCTTNRGLHISDDGGTRFRFHELPSRWQYTRGITPSAAGDGTVFLCNGNGPPGDDGRLLVSRDYGESWQDAGLPGPLNSTPWAVAVDPADPDLVFCASNLGQAFRSTDGGTRWQRLGRDFGEIRSLLWTPASS